MVETEDNKLIAMSLRGDNSAFDVLVKRYELQMYRTALGVVKDREAAKDVTQSGFIKCWKKLDGYNSKYKFYSWLYRIIVNEALNYVRDKKPHTNLRLHHTDGNNPFLMLQKKEENKGLVRAIEDLSTDYRIVIQLRHFEELPYKDIAHILNIEEKTVKSRLYSARIQLREKLQEA
jgi:RNA polymerase sigma-70 factor (ECF subfamily)